MTFDGRQRQDCYHKCQKLKIYQRFLDNQHVCTSAIDTSGDNYCFYFDNNE